MDETGMTLADKIALVEEMRETFGDEVARELAERYGLAVRASGEPECQPSL